jgi:RNA polymerase sigma-70 factor (ECF subfamily)
MPSRDKVFVLFDRIKRADATAMEELYADYSGSLYGQIIKLVSVEEVARELLQDVFIKVWQNIDSYDRNSGRPYTWMARIARNRAIDHLRSARSKRNHKTDELSDYVVNSEHLSATPFIDGIGLRKVVGQLDENHRELIEFLYFREYTQSETAKALDIPLGTVKTRARRAMQELRILLKNDLQSPLFALLVMGELLQNINTFFRFWI